MRHFPTWFMGLAILFFAAIAQSKSPPQSNQAHSSQDVKRLEDIADVTLDNALRLAGTEEGRDAVRLYLDTLMDQQRVSDGPHIYERLIEKIPHLVTGYCRPQDIPKYPEPCGTLFRIQLDVAGVAGTRSCGIALEPEARTREEIRAQFEQQATTAFALWNDVGQHLCLAKNDACHQMPGLLRTVAQMFRGANRTGKALEVRHILLDPRYGMQKTEMAQRARFESAQDLEESLLDFDPAAATYERFARDFPRHEDAPTALARAVKLRLMLHDETAAKRNAKQFESRFGSSFRPTLARMTLAIAHHALRDGRWADANAWLAGKEALFDRNQSIDVFILAHTYAARIAVQRGRTERAIAEYDTVRRAWQSSPDGRGESNVSGLEIHMLEWILNAVGEAEFFLAERAGRKIDAMKFPPFRGKLDEKHLLQYLMRFRAREWETADAILRAENEYSRILQIRPVAPPRWTIAATIRLGNMWMELEKARESIPQLTGPIPGRNGMTYEELRGIYAQHVEPSPWFRQARSMFQSCVSRAERWNVSFDEQAKRCERELARRDPQALRPVEEFHDKPTHSALRVHVTSPIAN